MCAKLQEGVCISNHLVFSGFPAHWLFKNSTIHITVGPSWMAECMIGRLFWFHLKWAIWNPKSWRTLEVFMMQSFSWLTFYTMSIDPPHYLLIHLSEISGNIEQVQNKVKKCQKVSRKQKKLLFKLPSIYTAIQRQILMSKVNRQACIYFNIICSVYIGFFIWKGHRL